MPGTLLGDESPLRKIPVQLERRQVLFLDGIRYAIEMAALAYSHLYQIVLGSTQRIAEAEGTQSVGGRPTNTALEVAAALLEAWSFVDSINRLRELLVGMPGLKKRTPEFRIFLSKTETFLKLRNAVQHLRGEIERLTHSGEPVWGSVGWVAVFEHPPEIVRSCSIYGGTVYPDLVRPVINPFSKPMAPPVDRLTLSAHGHTVSLTEIYENLELFTRALEKVMQESIGRDLPSECPTHAADVVVCLEFRKPPGAS